MTATERKWKPGDKITVVRTNGAKQQVTALRIVKLSGVREFALHEACPGEGYTVSHIGTGYCVEWGETKAQAVARAARRVSQAGGAAAIGAAVERHK